MLPEAQLQFLPRFVASRRRQLVKIVRDSESSILVRAGGCRRIAADVLDFVLKLLPG